MRELRFLVEALLARVPLEPTARSRGWYLAVIWLVSTPLSALNSLSHALQHLWLKAIVDAFGAFAGVGALWLLRRTGKTSLVGHVSLIAVLIQFGINPLASTPSSVISLIFVGFLPLQAAIVLGPAAAMGYGIAAACVGAFALKAIALGWTFPQATQAPLLEDVLNFVLATLVAAASAIVHDRARQRAYDELQAFEAARSTLLAHVSHELRTPLNGIVGMAEVLKLDQQNPGRTQEAVTVISNQAAALRAIVDDFLDFSKLEAGKLHLQPEPVCVNRLIDELAALHRVVAQHKGLVIEVEYRDRCPDWLTLDGARVRQVINNLLANAVKFTPNGSIRITVEHQNQFLRIGVTDSGPGLSSDAKQRLFRAFSQGDQSTSRRFGGTGLGLAISRALAEAMQGRIEVASVEGKGSTFTLAIPASAAERHPPTREEVSPRSHRSLHVLVVDDNAVNRLVAERLLSQLGHRVTLATDGSFALERMHREHFDVVLMDCHMPGLDGPETTRRYRQEENRPSPLPIIALTASALRDELEQCIAAGMNDTLTKPISLNALERALAEVATRPRAPTESA
jgi:signal transduction histidine kinase/ActR/RegA family two-component response regulator